MSKAETDYIINFHSKIVVINKENARNEVLNMFDAWKKKVGI